MQGFTQIEDWRRYIKEGGQFLRTARLAAEKRTEVFTPEIIYNITAMAIEKYVMGYLMSRGDLADNHTMGDLLQALERHAGPLPELAEKLRFLDSFQEICDIDAFKRRAPDLADIPGILAIGLAVESFVGQRLPA